MEAHDKSRNSFVVGNLRDLEVHIQEMLDVITQRLILSVLYPLEIVFVSWLLIGSDEIVDECLP
jgi:hypothetical protein